MTVAAVILAATPASALADADGTPGARRLADVAWAGGATPVVVCSFDPDGAVAAALANAEVTLVDPVAPEARPGRPRSSTASRPPGGLVADTDAALVWPARLAWVDAETVTTLIAAHGEDRVRGGPPGLRAATPASPSCCPSPPGAFRALRADRMPGELFADLEASGVPFRPARDRRPGRHPRRLGPARGAAAVRRPAGAGRRARHEWGAAAADDPDDAPVPGPARLPATDPGPAG